MASDLREIGLIDKRRMREFDALCNPGVEEIPSQKIKQLREEAHISQVVLAAVLNTSSSTVPKMGYRRQETQRSVPKAVEPH